MGNYEKVSTENNPSKWSVDGVLVRTFILITCFKVLLIPTYHSTDFEVHRNWLAITHNLPIKEWYFEATSQWTLDYPPLFAWFEYLLSQLAIFVDPEMLKIENLNYASSATILFQRATVMFADLMLVYGVREICKTFYTSYNSSLIFVVLALCNIGLLVVDHIHFQYNGFLLGILLLSVAKLSDTSKQASMLQGAIWFAILLNMKHIYLYVAPAYIVWLFKWYCLKSGHFFKRICLLGFAVLAVVALSFGPFMSELPQVLSRLFPFKRGLVHAYWAPNGWSLYIAMDKALTIMYKYLGWLKYTKTAALTGGLVQEQSLAVLPTPTPLATFSLSFTSMFPALWFLFRQKESVGNANKFVRCIVLCALSSFMFGWHVHEKAILTAIIPLCAIAATDAYDAKIFVILSSAGHTALLPLLYPHNLTPLKLMLLITYTIFACITLTRQFKKSLLNLYEWLYISMLPLVTIYESIVHKLVFNDKLPFLPLAIPSIYCAIGISYAWLLYYHIYLCDYKSCDKKKDKEKRQTIVQENKKQKIQ